MGIKIRTNHAHPCIFCGDAGYDMTVRYGPDEEVHWCHKMHCAKGDVVVVNGEQYICISSDKQISIGTFCLFKKYLTKEEWMAKQEATNPNWQKNSTSRAASHTARPVSDFIDTDSYSTNEPIENECAPLAPEQLDKIYRYFLSCLTLEEKHIELLRKEWDVDLFPNLTQKLMKTWPIKSLPPLDKVKFSNNENFRNPSRKKLVSALIKKFGSLEGVPGFYERTGAYWDSKPVEERWTFSYGEGIIFPCFDKDGYLYRIRFRDDYPSYRIKPGKGEFMGDSGYFHHSYNEKGEHIWEWYPDSDKKHPVLVYGEDKKLITLKNGCPTVGKVTGKYKNFSSLSERYDDVREVSFNKLHKGTRSGSPYSLYANNVDSWQVVIGTEGEKKAMVANAIKKVPLISVPGIWCYRCLFEGKSESLIAFLKKKGVKVFILCYDADKDENEDVLKAEAAFIADLKEAGIVAMKGEWSSSFDKGLDDILLMGLEFKVKKP